MGEQTWFRAETTNHKPASPGQYRMDFGDGLYLTSNKDVAQIYGTKRVAQHGGTAVITQVTIKVSELGRVLNLTTDPRWAKFYDTPLGGGKGMSPRQLMGVQENNLTIFQLFLSQHKIDISQYNAVIGPEHTHGGSQLVILHKNGAESQLAASIKARLVPVKPATATPNGTVVVKVGNGAGGSNSGVAGKVVSARVIKTFRFIGGTAVSIGLALFAAWLNKKVAENWMRARLAEIEPAIFAAINKRIASIADVMAKGKKAYANIIIEVSSSMEPYAGEYVSSHPVVKLVHVDISADNTNAEGWSRDASSFGQSKMITPYLYSVEVSVPDETVAAWSEFMAEWNWYEKQMQKTPTAALEAQQKSFRREIIAAFGDDADWVLSSWMWPKFKFKARSTVSAKG